MPGGKPVYEQRYRALYRYDPASPGITLSIVVSVKDAQVRIPDAKVDTGASFCVLSRGIGEALDLPIEAGIRQTVGLANGQLFTVYGHEVTIESQGLQLDLLAYFAEDPSFRRNVLGRQGWLAVVRLGLVDYDGELYLSHYNDSL